MSVGDYLLRVKAFLLSNRLQFVDDDERARKHYADTTPWVDPRSLVFAPPHYVEDVVRDAILLKLAGIDEPTVADLHRVRFILDEVKLSVSDEVVKRFLKEVNRR